MGREAWTEGLHGVLCFALHLWAIHTFAGKATASACPPAKFRQSLRAGLVSSPKLRLECHPPKAAGELCLISDVMACCSSRKKGLSLAFELPTVRAPSTQRERSASTLALLTRSMGVSSVSSGGCLPPQPASGTTPTILAQRVQDEGEALESGLRASVQAGYWLGELPTPSGRGPRRAYDPSKVGFEQVPAIRPSDGTAPASERVAFIAGMGQEPAHAANAAQMLADKTAMDVVGLLNPTAAGSGWGLVLEPVRGLSNILGLGHSPTTVVMGELLVQRAIEGKPITVYAHSDGATQLRNALRYAELRLFMLHGGGQRQQDANVLAMAKAHHALEVVTAVAFASPVRKGWPPGPAYVFVVNQRDPIANQNHVSEMGSFAAPLVLTISAGQPGNRNVHDLETYLIKWQEALRAQGAKTPQELREQMLLRSQRGEAPGLRA